MGQKQSVREDKKKTEAETKTKTKTVIPVFVELNSLTPYISVSYKGEEITPITLQWVLEDGEDTKKIVGRLLDQLLPVKVDVFSPPTKPPDSVFDNRVMEDATHEPLTRPAIRILRTNNTPVEKVEFVIIDIDASLYETIFPMIRQLAFGTPATTTWHEEWARMSRVSEFSANAPTKMVDANTVQMNDKFSKWLLQQVKVEYGKMLGESFKRTTDEKEEEGELTLQYTPLPPEKPTLYNLLKREKKLPVGGKKSVNYKLVGAGTGVILGTAGVTGWAGYRFHKFVQEAKKVVQITDIDTFDIIATLARVRPVISEKIQLTEESRKNLLYSINSSIQKLQSIGKATKKAMKEKRNMLMHA